MQKEHDISQTIFCLLKKEIGTEPFDEQTLLEAMKLAEEQIPLGINPEKHVLHGLAHCSINYFKKVPEKGQPAIYYCSVNMATVQEKTEKATQQQKQYAGIVNDLLAKDLKTSI